MQCYVGYRRLLRAISSHQESYPSDTFALAWHPFYLNPSASRKGIDKQAVYTSKFGAATEQIFHRLSDAGAPEGISFKFGGKTGSTRDAHRLIGAAGQVDQGGKIEGLQNKVVQELFAAYFEKEMDITDHSVLEGAAVRAGMEKNEVEKVLGSDVGAERMDDEAEKAREDGISGVPFFKIQGKFGVSGAQEPEAFRRVFQHIKASA